MIFIKEPLPWRLIEYQVSRGRRRLQISLNEGARTSPRVIIIDDFHDRAWVAPVWVFDCDAGVDYRRECSERIFGVSLRSNHWVAGFWWCCPCLLSWKNKKTHQLKEVRLKQYEHDYFYYRQQ